MNGKEKQIRIFELRCRQKELRKLAMEHLDRVEQMDILIGELLQQPDDPPLEKIAG